MKRQWKKVSAILLAGTVIMGSVNQIQGQNLTVEKSRIIAEKICTDGGIKTGTPSAITSGAGIGESTLTTIVSGGGISVVTQPGIVSGGGVQIVTQPGIVSSGGVQATPIPTNIPKEEQKVELTWKKKVKKVKAGKSYKFQVKVKGAKASKVTWSLSNNKYATISKKGVLTGKRKGSVTVKAKCKDVTLKCKVQILPKQVIGIDPGHQLYGNNGLEPIGPGASTKKIKVTGGTRGVATGVAEYELNLDIAKALKKELIQRGYDVVLTRNKHNVNITNMERAQKINKSNADICIRLHADGGPASATGASGLYPSSSNPYVGKLSAKSKKLSQCVLTAYCRETNIRNRGSIVRDDLTGTNWSTVPVIILEMGFMTNAGEDRYMQSEKGQKQMVEGIADGIDLYYK